MCYSQFFLTKLLTLGILFPTALRAVLVAKLVILGISLLNSFILTSRVVWVAELVISGILSSIFFILPLCTSFLLHNFLIYLNQQEQGINYQHLIYLLYFSNCSN